MELPAVAMYSSVTRSSVVSAVPVGAASAAAVIDGFARTALPFLLQVRGVQCLHASAVLTTGGVVAMCGDPGVGKSTMAAALERFGFPVWADDAVAFSSCPTGSRPTSVQLPFARRLSSSSDRLLASLPPLAGDSPPRPGAQRPLAALLVLQRAGDREPTVERLAPAAAFSAVVEHSYSFSLDQLDARRRFSEHQLGLVTTVPSLRVRFPGDDGAFATLVERVAAYVEALSGSSEQEKTV